MSTPNNPGGGPGPGGGATKGDKTPESPSSVRPDQTFAGAVQTASRVPAGRSWQQIFQDARDNRNIIELHITRIQQAEQAPQSKPLNHDDLSDFLFKILKIKRGDIVGIDYSGSGYGHREVELKAGVDPDPFIRTAAETYMNHKISVKKEMKKTTTKVLFRNVPLNVPDEEIINLAMCYGSVEGWVSREKLNNAKDRGMNGSNRTVEVNLNEGASFENYF